MINSALWRRQTDQGVPYKLLEGSPNGVFSEDDVEITEEYIILAQDLPRFIIESFSYYELGVGSYSYYVRLYRPARSCPGFGALVTRSVSFVPYPSDMPADPFHTDAAKAVTGTYTPYLKVTVTYSVGKSGDSENDFVIISGNSTGEFLLIPTSGVGETPLRWEGTEAGGATFIKDVSLPITKVLPGMEWSLKFPRVPRVSLPGLVGIARSLMGKVNTESVTLISSVPKECLLFAGFSFTTKYNWREVLPMAEIEFKLLEKQVVGTDNQPGGHNHFYNPETGKWQRIVLPNGEYVYEAVDFSGLILSGDWNSGNRKTSKSLSVSQYET